MYTSVLYNTPWWLVEKSLLGYCLQILNSYRRWIYPPDVIWLSYLSLLKFSHKVVFPLFLLLIFQILIRAECSFTCKEMFTFPLWMLYHLIALVFFFPHYITLHLHLLSSLKSGIKFSLITPSQLSLYCGGFFPL